MFAMLLLRGQVLFFGLAGIISGIEPLVDEIEDLVTTRWLIGWGIDHGRDIPS